MKDIKEVNNITFTEFIDIQILMGKHNGIVKISDWVKTGGYKREIPSFCIEEKNNDKFSSSDDNLIKNPDIEKFYKKNSRVQLRLRFNDTEKKYNEIKSLKGKFKLNLKSATRYFDYLMDSKGFDYALKFAKISDKILESIASNRSVHYIYSNKFTNINYPNNHTFKEKIMLYNTEHISINSLNLDIFENEEEIFKIYKSTQNYRKEKEETEKELKNLKKNVISYEEITLY